MQLDFISYTGRLPDETHTHAQIVLALEGEMEIEVGGINAKLDVDHCAFVPSGVIHSQQVDKQNKFLVVNCNENELCHSILDHLTERIFLSTALSTRQLLDFAVTAQHEHIPLGKISEHWVQLLLASLSPSALSMPWAVFSNMVNRVENSLDQPWSVRMMAEQVGLSQSRFYAVFQKKFKKTPQEWLTDLRIKKAQRWLALTDLPIADVALRVGYSDQSVLTRVMRRTTGLPPAAYRRQQQELWPKNQEQ
ncbi:MAG: AraC family transcriptional regulator [Desulfovibrio sp.]|uniref:AraC family transcriptional regulator n=1 Tax=Desulfovibrio sp. TaxID=885 RepID=UPI0039E216E7